MLPLNPKQQQAMWEKRIADYLSPMPSDSMVGYTASYIKDSLVALAFAALVGAVLMPTVGVVTGVALVGFSLLLAMPICMGMECIRNRMLKGVNVNDLKRIEEENSKFRGFNTIIKIALFFAALAAAQVICNSIPALSQFSYLDALQFGGIQIGLMVAAPLAIAIACGVCLCPCICCAVCAAPDNAP